MEVAYASPFNSVVIQCPLTNLYTVSNVNSKGILRKDSHSLRSMYDMTTLVSRTTLVPCNPKHKELTVKNQGHWSYVLAMYDVVMTHV